MSDDYTYREKAAAVRRVAAFHPAFTVGVIVLSVVAAGLEAVGLSFILPILELAQGEVGPNEASGVLGMFVTLYQTLGIPFTLGYLVTGVAAVMTVRFTSSFLVAWLRAVLETLYVKQIRVQAYDKALDARVAYFDQEGSDEILNAIITESKYSGRVIKDLVRLVEQGLLAAMYFGIALFIAPWLTLATAVVLGSVVVLFKFGLESGSSVGDRLAEANEEVQSSAQAGTQGIRDVKAFSMRSELFDRFDDAIDVFARSSIRIARNKAIITNFYQLVIAITVFVLIYVALVVTSLSLGALGVFLFAIFQLGPKVSTLSNIVYSLDSKLPHLIRTQRFLDGMDNYSEPKPVRDEAPTDIERVEYDDVRFSYETSDEEVLSGVSFGVERGEFVAFVGQSGAGKSTIISLFARMYEPDEGKIRADGTPINEFPVQEWRKRVSIVRQDPFIFNETLRYNLTIGNRDATQEEIEEVCEIAQVTEFFDDLKDGFDTQLGDDGIRLSGGQQQRIAIARALLKDADFLLLDEATSDLDTGLEEKAHSAIEAMDRDYGMIVVAHRLSTVTNADRIYTMDQGKIVERGDHRSLMTENGQYASLYDKQIVSGAVSD
ncbi:ABC transporter ATP-binding protein [Natronorubrum bangense]|uniref:Multidrug/lipids ABC transporter ATP-binding/permease protein n=1 Tax=Natronorubrum bangense JCM 10635 TaxID=1227500 RepID=L9W024_9EURY|nr:ABC transporter ATP-binding protein [Natronorubrum bangense]ELY42646.1 multidrug/lipids ABC transporter ATP-binding/permease protein [Natronorubrum bangense JCM 10635]